MKGEHGSPRIHEDLIEQEERVSRKRIIRLMREDGLEARARKRFKSTTMSEASAFDVGQISPGEFEQLAARHLFLPAKRTGRTAIN